MHCHEHHGISKDFLIEELLNFEILLITESKLILLSLIEISFSVEESLAELVEVKLWEMVFHVVSRILESLIAGQWQHSLLIGGRVNNMLPHFDISIVSEHQVVNNIVHTWVVK